MAASRCCGLVCFRAAVPDHRAHQPVEVVIGLAALLGPGRSRRSGMLQVRLNFRNFLLLWRTSLYLDAFASSVRVASVSTLLCLLIGYPMALGITRVREPAGAAADAGDPAVLDQLSDSHLCVDRRPQGSGRSAM